MTIYPDLEMKVVAGGPAGVPDRPHDIPAIEGIALLHRHPSQMCIPANQPEAMIDRHDIPIYGIPHGGLHHPKRDAPNSTTPISSDVNPVVVEGLAR